MAETEDQAPPAGGAPGAGAPLAPGDQAAMDRYKPALPYDEATVAAITDFFQKQKKKPKNYIFDTNGNLVIKNDDGSTKGNVQLKRFIPLDPTLRAQQEEGRLELIAAIESEYEETLEQLRIAKEGWVDSGDMRPVMELNQKLMDLDARRNAARSAVREVVLYPNPTVRDVDKSQPKEDRKMGFGVYGLRLYPFQLEHEYGQYVPDEDAPAPAEGEAGPAPAADLSIHQPLKDGRLARIFFDPAATEVNGFLSPMWPVEFTLDGSRYFTALQAYEAERAKELGEAALRETILKTRSARTIRILVKKIAGKHPKDPKGLWLRILTAAFQQHEVLKQQLLATGTDALVYADLQAGPSGVGLAKEDRAILDSAKWKGENAVGVALETLRTQLREGNAGEAPEEDAEEGVITEEEQQKAKVGAIINARRNGAA